MRSQTSRGGWRRRPVRSSARKVALVTGGARGIGAASAKALADQGADVAISHAATGVAEAVVADLKAKGERRRRRIVNTAAAEFRRNGVNGTGLAELMKTAGLTHGGFYRHFESKGELVAEACAAGMESVVNDASAAVRDLGGKSAREAIAVNYLSPKHRDDLAGGCPLAALGSELARCDQDIRKAATKGFLGLVDVVARQYPRSKPDVARARAMVGAVTMARVVTDPELSTAILEETRKHLVDG